ncbi:YqjF family protein [Paenibacillus sp. YYML68]|uniref:YqjF family protein n=1 Tax=Paenibacillus sp. YYML68 TaxID=2909250 RepID=UPI0024906343|nr:DUF2071 domain-containing protein [Paenibacillus sp. YYML68]
MHPLLRRSSHRPWPLPELPWIMKQTWHDLLFAHWPISMETLARYVPGRLPIDTYEGTAWIAVVPFGMCGIRGRGLPPIPGTSRFPELNVRTYVTLDGKPGVYFFSLDASSMLAVLGARRFFHLPYYHAAMKLEREGETIVYTSRRRDGSVQFAGTYRPVSAVFRAAPGSLAHWLTERYCLYTENARGQLLRCDIHHDRWPLQLAEAQLSSNTMLAGHPLVLGGETMPDECSNDLELHPPLLHYASSLDVLIWPLVHV